MSTRWYPIYQKGNPQLRIFLPNFCLKLVKPTHDVAPNVVQFACPIEMTRYDVKNYLEKIYKIPVVHVTMRIALGKTRGQPNKGYVIKDDDIKYAYVTLPKDEVFEFPDLFPKTDKELVDEYTKTMDITKEGFKKYLSRAKNREGLPGWFSF